MGTYSSIASGIKTDGSSINSDSSSIGTSFSFGSDETFESLFSKLKSVKSEIESQYSTLNEFAEILKKVDQYIDAKDNVSTLNSENSRLRSQVAGLDSKNDAATIASLNSNIRSNESKIASLEGTMNEIKNAANSFNVAAVNKEYEVLEPETPEDLSDLSFDIEDLLSKFKSGSLSKIADGDSLYNYYNKDEVVNYINEIKKEYSGRQAAVYSALAVIDLAVKAGGKLDYDWGGGHNNAYTTLDDVAAGTDCSAFASWAVNQGTDNSFYTQTSETLISSGTAEDLSSAKPGDLLVRYSNGSGHVYFVVENNTEAGKFIVAEAYSQSVGVQLSEHAYSELSGVYSARDMSAVYGE